MDTILCRSETDAMKITVELPDPLYREAKAEAALRGHKLKIWSRRDYGSCSKRRLIQRGIRTWQG